MDDTARIFKALSDRTRLRIVKLLQHGELCVCDIGAALGMAQPKISFHLRALKDSGLLKDRKRGKWIHYSLNESDMFKRFLLLSVNDRISGEEVKADRERLERFQLGKPESERTVSITGKRTGCCEDNPVYVENNGTHEGRSQ
ncbi:MAG: HTH-type transcriptional repressor AseR [Syntrophorhabdaceae bacterium PtaU1.Bin034]|jgi:ArsR family transcriptional regulator|nr:MAG: HTH-type transcriptional repressor AseR [Syntrophorhabdaceae bacterium PtaU1.Bin034]